MRDLVAVGFVFIAGAFAAAAGSMLVLNRLVYGRWLP